MTRSSRSIRVLAAVVTAGALGAGATAIFAATAAPVVREPLAAIDNPVGGKGRTLGLSRVTVPPGAQLALHHHLGTQTAYIAQGVLTYTVRSGSVAVMQGPAESGAKLVRHIKTGQTGSIKAGQWIVEQPTTIHRAGNNGSKPVVIYLATLFPIGSPPSVPVSSR
jgi:quercetin dioxygenase-like cupin family protein